VGVFLQKKQIAPRAELGVQERIDLLIKSIGSPLALCTSHRYRLAGRYEMLRRGPAIAIHRSDCENPLWTHVRVPVVVSREPQRRHLCCWPVRAGTVPES